MIDRILAHFRGKHEGADDLQKTLEMQKDLKRRISNLEKIIERAQMDGEDSWFLCTQRRAKDDNSH